MMDRREALLLVERLKRRTRDPDVLALCEHFEHEALTLWHSGALAMLLTLAPLTLSSRPPPAAIWPRICASDGRR